MKINNKFIVLTLLLTSLLTITVTSQIPQTTNLITVEEPKTCNTIFFDEVQEVYGNCIHYHNYTSCLNTTGPNTACSLKQDAINFRCKIKDITVKNNRTECRTNKFVVSINKGIKTEQKEIDFTSWGVCVQEVENNCITIICGSQHGGSAVNGKFNGCDGGKSCQKFLFCPDETRVLYKGSRSDFVEHDPTFHLSKLPLKEVGQ